MKKIIPALALLLISAVVMSTASFAWFSMNTSVTASGMSVKAQSTGGLAIASYVSSNGTATAPGDSDFSTSADASATGKWTNGTGDLTPTSTANAQTWYTTTAANVNNYGPAKQNTYTEITANAGAGYYRHAKFQVKSLDEGTAGANATKANLYVTDIKVSTAASAPGSANLNKALRVAVVDSTNAAHFFAPVYTGHAPTGSFRYVSSTTATGTYGTTSAPTLSFINCTNAQPVQILSGTLDTEPQDISIYVYYEGEDDNCFSLNAVNIDTLSVSVTFSTTGGTATAGD